MMKYRQTVTSNRNRTAGILALAVMVGMILLVAFHHHENDNHCLICLLLSSPVLYVVSLVIILMVGCAGMGLIGDQPVSVPKPAIIIYSLRAPPVSL